MPHKDPEARKAYNVAYNAEHKEEKKAYRVAHKKQMRANSAVYRATTKGKYRDYKSSAKQRGLEFCLSITDFEAIISIPCKHCGGPGYGVDRIDNNKGYTLDNCQPCCTVCNIMKNALSDAQFYAKMAQILRNQGFFDICPTPNKR